MKIHSLRQLTHDPHNRRRHTPRNLDMLKEALGKVGASRSIVIDETGEILAGNGVVQAATSLGLDKVQIVDVKGDTIVAVRRSGLTAEQKRALALYDNRTAELAEWNAEQLAADVAAGLDLQSWFTAEELRDLLPKAPAAGQTDPDAVPAERPTDIQPGDLFQLGAHRLLCGDALEPAVVDRVLPAGSPAATLVTSPPYWTKQPYDDQPGEAAIRGFMDRFAATWAPRVRRRIQIETGHTNNTLCGDKGPLRKILLDGLWQAALAPHGWLLRHRRVWGKKGDLGGMTGPLSDLIDESWEMILTFYRPNHNEGGMERNDNAWVQVGVWTDIRGEHIDGHPCPFPVAIPQRMISMYSVPADIVAEPFCGSGTTVIACEQLGRACVALDRSPSYCQVAIDRWEAFTGRRAVQLDRPRAAKVSKRANKGGTRART